jgi:hypothetical protein
MVPSEAGSGRTLVTCLVDARAPRSLDRLSGTYLTERSALSASVVVRERRLTLLPRPGLVGSHGCRLHKVCEVKEVEVFILRDGLGRVALACQLAPPS